MLSQLGPYLIDEELAQGGMARVFRARLRGLGGFEKTLVIKQIKPELAKDPRFVALFVREANTLVSLSHPHIVPVYELGSADGSYYLSMEYIEGATVHEMLALGPLEGSLVAHIGAQVCEALEYAHSRFGILHRDISPRNIIVDQAGHARVLDFGIAASADAVDPVAFGSPGYMAPEQITGQRVSAQSDLFSLGAVFYEALTGESAFPDGTLRTRRPDLGKVPDELRALVTSMLAEASSERPASAAQVARVLRASLAKTRPHGVLEDMQSRVRAARAQPAPPTTTSATAPRTERIEAQVIATSPVLVEMLRSSGGSPLPSPPRDIEADAGSRTVPLEERAQAKDRTNARLTAWLMRAWPLAAVLSLVAAFLVRNDARRSATTSATAPRPTSPSVPAPALEDALPIPAPEPPKPSAPEPAPTPPKEVSASSSLTLNAKPWAHVTLDGRALGPTPLRSVKLSAGVHVVTLDCPPLGRNITLKIEPTARVSRMVVDLNESPARTFLDGVREAY